MTGDSVVVVSAARGGSACSTTGETIYGTWAEKGVLPLFDAAMAKCNSAIAVTGLKFSGVIWLQGERDANAINDGKMDGEDYEAALRNLILRFRKHLHDADPSFLYSPHRTICRPSARGLSSGSCGTTQAV